MQKKIIALAVAGLVSGAAFAQSNVTIYGIMDMGYTNYSDSAKDGVGSKNGIDSGSFSTSRIGFKGTEDLGNGLKAVFQHESKLNVDNGGDTLGTRQSYVGLAGGFGTVVAGKLQTPQDVLLSKVDPSGGGNMTKMHAGMYTETTAIGGATFLGNAAAYISPNFSGFSVVAAYSNNAFANETEENAGDIRVWALNPSYENGPIFVGFNYHNAKSDSDFIDNDSWDLGGTYDFGILKLHAMYGQDDLSFDNAANSSVENDKWFIGVSAPLGNGTLFAAYGQSEPEYKETGYKVSDDIKKWSIGYKYNMSKRTYLYGAYADISSDDETALVNGEIQGVMGSADWGAGGSLSNAYRTGFQFGMVHAF